ncbi:cupredoxin domain-containing protein [Halobacterium litoreum]|uniref:Tat (Twin-arginine translocation) pathway signal sequence n=1 Tax=Halobacterium litoreum TaxID=2039234 RepID=A0ABD5NED4_9EURY|nr:hypothetical protein [Halobacterium litoreum]UHH13492.1 hypothetical protein LT972_00505 [Halobacterium litoreum]
MNRRRFLAASGVALSTAAAGCLSSPGSAGDDAPACPQSVPRFERADYDGDVRVVCDAASDDAPTDESALAPTPRTTAFGGDAVTFEFANRRDEHYNIDPHAWTMQKRVDGEWRLAVPTRSSMGESSSLAPGTTYTWALSFPSQGSSEDLPLDAVSGDSTATIRGLTPGMYAFHVWGSYGDAGGHPAGNEPIVAYAAQFSLEDA